jgi:CspA family cold shock protein
MKGVVKWFDNRPGKGFGFIVPESGGPDVFAPLRGIAKHIVELHSGQNVQYEVRPSRRGGQEAFNVEPIAWKA